MKKKYGIKDLIYSRPLMYLILLILLLSNCYLGTSILLKKFIQFFSLVLLFLLLLFYILSKKYNKTILYFILYCVSLLFSCVLGEYSNVSHFFAAYSSIIAIFLYLEIGLKTKCKDVILCANNIYFLLILVNFITIILFPNGLYGDSLYSNNWFFKYDNLHIYMYLPAIVFNFLSLKYNKKIFFKNLIEHLIILFCILYCKSATSLVAYFLLVLCFLFRKKLEKNKLFIIKNYFTLYLFIFVFIIILRVQNIFEWFIVGILHKSLTFTTRTDLWDTILIYIKKKPILGYGIENSTIFREKMGSIFYSHAHNTIYDILYKGGLVSLFFHFKMLLDTLKNVSKEKNIISTTLSFLFLSVFITLNFEAREEVMGLYIIIIVASNIKYIIESIKEVGEYEKENGIA